jgi:hypothetical protein
VDIEWIRWHLDLPDITLQRNIALARSSDLFKLLGNTGTAVDRRWNTGNESLPERHTAELRNLHPDNTLIPLLTLRHPDPSLTPKMTVTIPALQVLGSWKKLVVRKKNELKPRLGFTSFIWNGMAWLRCHGIPVNLFMPSRPPIRRRRWSRDPRAVVARPLVSQSPET